jgi:hypothetical protein
MTTLRDGLTASPHALSCRVSAQGFDIFVFEISFDSIYYFLTPLGKKHM